MAFSGALTLTDLNDFITPSQACIKPVEQTNKPTEEKGAGAAVTEIRVDESGYYEVSQAGISNGSTNKGRKLEQAQISLNDCLACSGCITSAESVLITLQSHTEVLSVLSNDVDERIPIISIAPQSLASLAAAYSPQPRSASSTNERTSITDEILTPREVFHRVRRFCTSILGFAYVFDTNFARHLALKEHVKEFIERQQEAQQKELTNGDSVPHPTITGALPLPMLASACPGWICYAEKAHSEMLPFIARTKSPQQVMGTLVKQWIGKKLGKRPDEIYHVSVMPCYDKKLEASRQDFYDDVFKTRDVDCVVTTGELELMMKEFGWDLNTGTLSPVQPTDGPSLSIPVKKNTPINLPGVSIPELLNHPGTSSGSYLHAILRHFMSTSPVPLTLSVKAVRNAADHEEYILRETPIENGNTSSKIVFKGIKCYGFRNLQNVVRKVGRERGVRVESGAAGRLGSAGGAGAGRGVRKIRAVRKGRGAEDSPSAGGEDEDRRFDYVEVMACPGGCVNGGGQLKPPAMPNSAALGDIDAEGYKRDWDGEGVAPSVGAKWGDRDWTKKVEEVYWRDAKNVDEDLVADQLVDEVLEELCAGDDAERKRLLRTEYRAVESDVIGLAVKW
ncbi:iron hydrogenase [Macrolepiota fuliginosa MF-IS2]|uniref:Iron hydrogenase n=1 Tax=Macrolepiota fuliginosa MF-IS2 TaxID=1400762 RepID=A0A9P5XMR6_9AGAR|nr:iron hydrogenase [Macrolepiota fuliginosa MF-IS2]